MRMLYWLAVGLCMCLASEGIAFSMQIRMAYQRHNINELIFVRMDGTNLNAFYACDPDGYYHRVSRRELVGKARSKIVKIEWNQVLLETPYLDVSGQWLLNKQWKKIVPHLSKDAQCPLTKEDKRLLKLDQ